MKWVVVRFHSLRLVDAMKTLLKWISRFLAGVVAIPLLAIGVPLMLCYRATTWLMFKLGDWALLGRIEDD